MTVPRLTAEQSDLLRGNRFAGGLRPTVVGRAEALAGRSLAVLLLEDGAADLATEAQTIRLAGPVLTWLPWAEDGRMTIAPGAVGAYLVIGAATLRNAIGHLAESVELRALSDRRLSLSLAKRRDLLDQLRTSFAVILDEEAHAATAARTIIEAHLQILLVRVWRAYDVALGTDHPRSPAERIFNRFNGLVELHFRDRWPVLAYAAALNLSRDRLGDICRRVGGRSPKEIVSTRLAVEARLLLQQSTHSVEEIAGILGFASASHFSHFFVRMAGQPPGRYRQDQSARAPLGAQDAEIYSWP